MLRLASLVMWSVLLEPESIASDMVGLATAVCSSKDKRSEVAELPATSVSRTSTV